MPIDKIQPRKKVEAPKPQPKPSAPKPVAKALVKRDEMSNGRGSALKRRGLKATGADLGAGVKGTPSPAKSFSARELLAKVGKLGSTGGTSLRTEVLGDGKANCLERAVAVAKPGESVVLLTDKKDPVGHAVVKRKDGTVLDPNNPGQPYASVDAFITQNPRYGNPATLTDKDAEKILHTPPGKARNALITRLGLDGVASRVVADPPQVTASYDAQAKTEAAQVATVYETTLKQTGSESKAAEAAAVQLETFAEASSDPVYVAKLTAAAAPTIDKIATQVAKAANGEMKDNGNEMKATVKALAAVADAGGQAAADVIAGKLAAKLPDDDELHAVDDALFEAIGEGGSTDLARSLHVKLLDAGKTEAAEGLADNEHDGGDLEENVAREAKEQLDSGTDPATVYALYGPYIEARVCENLANGNNEGLEDGLALLTDLGAKDPELAQTITHNLAQAIPADISYEDMAFIGARLSEMGGPSTTFGVDLMSELTAAGKPDAAALLGPVVASNIEAVRTDYEDAQHAVDEANEELAYMIGNFGPLFTDQQKTDAINDFKARHSEVYDRLETEAANFAAQADAVAVAADPKGPLSSLPPEVFGEVREQADRALINVLPRIGGTVAGSELVGDALEAQAAGKPSFFDVVGNLELTDEQIKEYASDDLEELGVDSVTGFASGVAETMFQGAALRLATNPEASDALLRGISKNAKWLGVDAAKLDAITADTRLLASAGTDAERAVIAARIKENSSDLGLLGVDTRAGQAFQGFNTILGVLSAVDGFQEFGDAAVTEKIATISGALGTSIGAYELVLGVTGRAASISTLAGKGSGVLAGLGAVLEGISAVQSFADGDLIAGTGHSLTAIGSGILAVAACSELVPVAGQIVGGVLLAVGFGFSIWANVQKSNEHEGPSQDFLEGAGLSPKLAEELSNHGGDGFSAGPALAALADRLGITGPQLVQYLETLSEDQLQHIIEDGVHPLEMDGAKDADGNPAFPTSGDDAKKIADYYATKETLPNRFPPPQPDSIEGLALWLQGQGLLPPGATI